MPDPKRSLVPGDQHLRLQQYELQQLEIERQQLALQAEKEAYQARKTESAKAYHATTGTRRNGSVKGKAYWAKLQREAKQRLESSKKQNK